MPRWASNVHRITRKIEDKKNNIIRKQKAKVVFPFNKCSSFYHVLRDVFEIRFWVLPLLLSHNNAGKAGAIICGSYQCWVPLASINMIVHNHGVNAKQFYLLPYIIALRTFLLSPLDIYSVLHKELRSKSCWKEDKKTT